MLNLVTKDGRDLKLRIVEINERAIIGESHGKNHQISVNEILKLEKYNDSTEDTILKTLLLIPLAVGVFFAIILKKPL